MADRYWVGGTGNWTTTTTNWSATSGGAGGATVPTAADNVIFDANSNIGTGAFIVTVTSARTCLDLTVNGLDGAMTLAGTQAINISGNLSLPATNFTCTLTGSLTFDSTVSGKTITTSGNTITAPIVFNGTGGVWALQDALTTINFVNLTAGTLKLEAKTLTCTNFLSTGAVTRVVDSTGGTGFITITGAGTALNIGGSAISATGVWEFVIANPTANATTVTNSLLAQNMTINTGTYALTLTNGNIFNNLNLTGFNGSWAAAASILTILGNVIIPATGGTYSATAGANTFTFAGTNKTSTITTNGRSIPFGILINGTGLILQLADALTTTNTVTLNTGTIDINAKTTNIGTFTIVTGTHAITNGTINCSSVTHTSGDLSIGTGYNVVCTGVYTFTAGTITIANGVTLTAGSFSSNNANVRSIAFGTGNVRLTGSGTIWTTNDTTSFSYTGTSNITVDNAGSTATTVTTGAMTLAQALNFNFISGTYALTLTSTGVFNNLSFIGFTGSVPLAASNITVHGSLAYGAGTTSSSTSGSITLAGTSARTITSNGATVGHNIIINGVSGTYTLQDAFTSTNSVTLTAGTLSLNTGFTLTASIFSSSVGNVRSIAFGTGNIRLTGSGTIWNTVDPTNFSYTGTPTVNIANAGSTATTVTTGAMTLAQALNFNFISGTYALTLTSGSIFNNLSFVGFAGSVSLGTALITVHGNLAYGAGTTSSATSGSITLAGTSARTITSNGASIGHNLNINGVSGTYTLQDNLTQPSTAIFTLTNGTLDINAKTTNIGIFTVIAGTHAITNGTLTSASVTHTSGDLTVNSSATLISTGAYTFTAGSITIANGVTLTAGSFSSNLGNVRSIAFGTGNVRLTGSGTIWTTTDTTSFSYTGNSNITVDNAGSTATTVTTGPMTLAQALNFNFISGTYALTLTSTSVFNNLSFVGFTGSVPLAANTITVHGNLAYGAGTTSSATSGSITLAGTSARTITSNGASVGHNLNINGALGTYQLQDNLTQPSTIIFTLTNGTLDINAKTTNIGIFTVLTGTHAITNGTLTAASVAHTSGDLSIGTGYNVICTGLYTFTAGSITIANGVTLTAGSFSSNNVNARSIAFGTGNVRLTGSGTIWDTTTTSSFSYTGNSNITVDNAGSTATTVTTGAMTLAQALNFNFISGSYALTLTSTGVFNNLSFIGFTGSVPLAANTITVHGNLAYGAGTTSSSTSGSITLAGTSTRTITSNGATVGHNIVINGVSGTYTLQDALTSTNSLTLTAGTLSLNTGFTLTAGSFSSNNANIRSIAFGTGNVRLTGSGTIWDTTTPSNFSYTGTPTVNIANAGATATTVTTGPMTLAQALNFNFISGTYALTLTSTSVFNNLSFVGFTGSVPLAANTITVHGNLAYGAGTTSSATSGVVTLAGTSARTITSNGASIGHNLNLNGALGTYQLQDNLTQPSTVIFILTNGTLDINAKTTNIGIFTVVTGTHAIANGTLTAASVAHTSGDLSIGTGYNVICTGLYTFTAGSITIANGVTLTAGSFSSNNANVRSIAFGTGNVRLTGSGTVWDTTTTSSFSYTGNSNITVDNAGSTATTVTTGAMTLAQSLNFNFISGTYPLTLTSGNVFNNLSFVGFTGSVPLAANTITVHGNLAYGAGTTSSATSGVITLAGTSARTITTNGASVGHNIVINGASGTYQLQDNLTQPSTVIFTLTNGTLDINAKTTNIGIFTVITGTHAISNGILNCVSVTHTSGDLTVNSSATLISTGVYIFTAGTITIANGVTLTAGSFSSNNANIRSIAFGTGNVRLTGSGTVWDTTTPSNFSYTGTPTVNIANAGSTATTVTTGAMTLAQALNFNFISGTYALTLTSTSVFNNLSFVGFTGSVPLAANTITVHGNLAYGAGTTSSATSGVITLAGTSARTITSNGASIGHNLNINGALGTYQLQDNLTQPSTVIFTLTNGTLDINAKTTNIGIFTVVAGTHALTNGTLTAASVTHTSGDLTTNSTALVICTGLYTFTAGSITIANGVTLTAGSFSSSNGNARSIAFGTGNVRLTGSGTVWDTTTTSSFSYTGNSNITVDNAGSTATTVTTGAMTLAQSLNFNFISGTYALTLTSGNVFNNLSFVGFTGSVPLAANNITVHGNLVYGAGTTSSATSGVITLAGTSARTITTNGASVGHNIVINGISGTYTLQDAFTSTNSLTLTAGTLSLNTGFTLTAGSFSSNNANIRSIAFGTGNVRLTGSGTVWDTTTPSNFSYTGTPTVNIANAGSTATTVITGPMTLAQSLNFNFISGTYTLTLTSGNVFNNLSFVGFTGSVPLAANIITVHGNLAYGAGTTSSSTSGVITLAGTSARTITSNGASIGHNLNLNGALGTYQLQDNLTQPSTIIFTLTNGTLDINAKTTNIGIFTVVTGTHAITNGTLACSSVAHTSGDLTVNSSATLISTGTYTFTAGSITIANGVTLTAGSFSSSNGNVRSIAFGTGNIRVTGSGNLWDTSTSTSLSFSGTSNIVVATTTATPCSTNTTLPMSFSISSGTTNISMFGTYININFTGFRGTLLQDTTSISVSGNLTLSSTMVSNSSSGVINLVGTTSPTFITSNGHVLGIGIVINRGISTAETQLADALSCTNSTGLAHTAGIFNTNSYNVTLSTFASLGAGVRSLIMGSSIFTILGTLWNTDSVLSVTPGTSTINMVSYAAKSFIGSGKTWYKLNQGGLGALTIVNNNTFNDISNTVQPTSILFTTGSTTTLSNLSLQGTSDSLVNISSTTAGTHTLTKSSGTIALKFCSISYSIATGGATWNASISNYNSNNGNNTGWLFGALASLGNFFAFF